MWFIFAAFVLMVGRKVGWALSHRRLPSSTDDRAERGDLETQFWGL
jgi:hypothetical protein